MNKIRDILNKILIVLIFIFIVSWGLYLIGGVSYVVYSNIKEGSWGRGGNPQESYLDY